MMRKFSPVLLGLFAGALGLGLALTSSTAQEEKEKKEEKPLEVTGAAKVNWADVPAGVKSSAAKETGSSYTWSKGKADTKDVYVVTFKRFAKTTKLVLAADGKVLLREDTTVEEKDAKAGKAKADEKTAVVAAKTPTYVKDIKAILNANCKMCHDVAKRKADLDLITSYNTVMEAVKAGNPGGSDMFLAITGNGKKRMPPDKRLDIADIATIKAWIAAGAKEK